MLEYAKLLAMIFVAGFIWNLIMFRTGRDENEDRND